VSEESDDSQKFSFAQHFSIIGTGTVGKEVVEALKEEYEPHLPLKCYQVFDEDVPDPNQPYANKYGHAPIPPPKDVEPQEGEHVSLAARIKGIFFGKKTTESGDPEKKEGGEEPETPLTDEVEEAADEDKSAVPLDEDDPEYKEKLAAFKQHQKYKKCLDEAICQFKEEDVVMVFTSIEDEKGFTNAQDLAQAARDNGAFSIVVVFLPLRVDAAKDIDPWDKMMQDMRLKADVVFILPNYILIQNKGVYGFITEFLDVVTQSGVVNLDLADVKVVTKGGNVGVVGIGITKPQDDDRVKEAFRRALKHPLFRIDILSANKLLVNVFGDDTMSLQEAETVAEEVQALVREKTRIIWGATVGEQYKKNIKIFLMVGVKPKEVLVHLYANSGR